jgi:[ribosomal protein S5]-alanine N-acetyltransferase
VNVLLTRRLRLEPLGPDHTEALLAYEVRNREHLRRWEPSRKDEYYTLANIRRHIDDIVAQASAGRCARFVAFGGDELVAVVNLWEIRRGPSQTAALGYSVDVGREGCGFATEAAEAVARYAFEVLNLHRIETHYQPENERSARVLEKLGFVIEGRTRQNLFIDGAWRDGVLVALINDAWRPPIDEDHAG